MITLMLRTLFVIILSWVFVDIACAEVIKQIKVQGNSRVAKEYIASLLSSEVGKDYNQNLLNSDLKNFYSTELFSKITGQFINGTVTISVVENPLVENITISGNNKIKEEDMTKEMQSKRRTTFSLNKLKIDIQRITELYYRSGYFSAIVSYELERKDYNRVHIKINITEGKKTTIDLVKFIGNSAFDKAELEGVTLTKESKWWRILNSGDVYDKNRILYDGELLRQFYLENGYPNFSVVSTFTEISLDNNFIVTYVVEEGDKYKFGDVNLLINLKNLQPYEEEIKREVDLLAKENWFKNSVLQRQVLKIKEKINELGFQFIKVEPQMIYNDVARRVDIIFVVDEDSRLFINKINIKGNTRSRDYVLRRELKFSERDAYDTDRIALAKRNLSRTGYFSAAEISDVPSDIEGEVNLNVDVEEISTGSISVGGGYSSIDKIQFEASYSETNLFGTGKYFGINLNLSRDTNVYSISLSDPYFLDKELFASVSLYRRDTGASDYYDYELYKDLEQGIATSIGYNLTDNVTQKWGYNFFYRNIYEVDPAASISIKEIEGSSFVSSVSHTITYNTTDSAVFTTKGVDLSLYTEYAGVLGDTYYAKNTAKGIWYYELLEEVVFSALGSVGVIEGLRGQDVQIIDKYQLGGPTLRGFAIGVNYGGVGPVDATTGESLGGKYMYRGSFQIETPLPGVKQYGLIVYTFTDFGTVTDFSNDPNIIDTGSLRVSVGAGLSWRSPAGVISLDVGFPVKKEPTDVTERVFLNFGTRM